MKALILAVCLSSLVTFSGEIARSADAAYSGFIQRQNLSALQSGIRTGHSTAAAYTHYLMGDECANYLVSAQLLQEYEDRLKMLNFDPESYYDYGLKVGWIGGAQTALQTFGQRCEEAVQKNLGVSFRERRAECLAKVKEVGIVEAGVLPVFDLPSGPSKSEFESMILSLINRGKKLEAWQKVLDRSTSEQRALPCLSVLSIDPNSQLLTPQF